MGMGQPSRITTNGKTYEQIRADILSGRLPPGERLKFSALTAQYGAKSGVLRETLVKLSSEGLVLAEPRRGFSVTPIWDEDLRDLTEVRCDLEGVAFQYAMERGDLAWEGRVTAAHHTLQRTQMEVDGDPKVFSEEWAAAHADFHLALIEGCGNRRLINLATLQRDSSELYRRWSKPLGDPHRDIAGEHLQLRDAAVNRNVQDGVELLRSHIRRTTEKLLEAVHPQRP